MPIQPTSKHSLCLSPKSLKMISFVLTIYCFFLQNVMPALVDSIKGLGLVLVADTSEEPSEKVISGAMTVTTKTSASNAAAYRMPAGVNGVMRGSGVLRFNDTIDM